LIGPEGDAGVVAKIAGGLGGPRDLAWYSASGYSSARPSANSGKVLTFAALVQLAEKIS